jgi:hypothetical protein
MINNNIHKNLNRNQVYKFVKLYNIQADDKMRLKHVYDIYKMRDVPNNHVCSMRKKLILNFFLSLLHRQLSLMKNILENQNFLTMI